MFKYKKSNECLNKFTKVSRNKLFLLKIIDMKKLALLLFIGGIFTSCNDGDLVFDELNFSSNVEKCDEKEIYYKLNNNEMLFIYIPNLINDNLVLNQEYSHTINNSNEMVYRQYSDRTSSGLICDIITPAFPQVVEEFKVNGGQIKYKYFRKTSINETSGNVTIDYVYSFNFQNIVLANNSGKEMKYENYFFGEYQKKPNTLNFNLGNNLNKCNANNFISINGSQIFEIISPEINLQQTVGVQTINLNNSNKINIFLLEPVINADVVCEIDFSNSDIIKLEDWNASQGVLEIVTTENPNVQSGFTRTFILKNVVFKNQSDSFIITEQILGTYTGN